MRSLLALSAALGLLSNPVLAADLGAPVASPEALVARLDIPTTRFVLKNGLTVIVHEDHKVPIVAVNIWYHVGSKNEPKGRSGFAHLFEHLMFGGRNGDQKGWFDLMEEIGATRLNGTTNSDRTNFFESVPTPALDRTLFLESQRMGHLLDHFDEKTLTTQRGVVQNEKREDENEPYALSDEVITQSVWPAAHPYSHTVIGEMDDLNAASIADVKDWYAKYYGPTNAVLVLAGDITPAEAKAKVERYFADLPPGPPVIRQSVWIAKRTGEQRAVAQDHVNQARVYKVWNVPATTDASMGNLYLLSSILGDGKSSRLYKRLVFQDQIASQTDVSVDDREIGGLFEITVTGKPGVDPKVLETAINQEVARLFKDGISPEELSRAKSLQLAAIARGIESVGGFDGKSDQVAQAQTYRGDPDAWKDIAKQMAAATPADILSTGKAWLSDGAFVLTVTPFPEVQAETTGLDRSNAPEPGAPKPPQPLAFQRATLSNGLKVIMARRAGAPLVVLTLFNEGGEAASPPGKEGLTGLENALIADGPEDLDALRFSDRLEDLGATFHPGSWVDGGQVRMDALSVNLDASLDLFADAALHPAFRSTDLERERQLKLAALKEAKDSPRDEASRLYNHLIWPNSAYGRVTTEASLNSLTRDDVVRQYEAWRTPLASTLVVVGDIDPVGLIPKLEKRFGAWKATPPPNAPNVPAAPQTSPVIYLVDHPDAQQSVILGALPTPKGLTTGNVAAEAMNTVLGGAFTSRLNMNLREDKHWSYGAFSWLETGKEASAFVSYASVQTDKTKESLMEMRREMAEATSTRPIDAGELDRAKRNITLSLPGEWERDASVAGTLVDLVRLNLPDSFYDSFASRIQALDPKDANAAAKAVIKPDQMVWLVVGDRKRVEPGLKSLGLEVRLITDDGEPLK